MSAEVVPTLDDEFAELIRAVLPVVNDHQEEMRNIVSKHAEELIKSGKWEVYTQTTHSIAEVAPVLRQKFQAMKTPVSE